MGESVGATVKVGNGNGVSVGIGVLLGSGVSDIVAVGGIIVLVIASVVIVFAGDLQPTSRRIQAISSTFFITSITLFISSKVL